MLKNNIMFEEHEVYDYEEVCSILSSRIGETGLLPMTKEKLNKLLTMLNYFTGVVEYSQNPFGLSFLELSANVYQGTDISLVFFNKLYQRFRTHICFDILSNVEYKDEVKYKQSSAFFRKIVNLLDYNYPKYSLLIEQYNTQNHIY